MIFSELEIQESIASIFHFFGPLEQIQDLCFAKSQHMSPSTQTNLVFLLFYFDSVMILLWSPEALNEVTLKIVDYGVALVLDLYN